MESQLVFTPSLKREDRMESHHCKVNKKSYRSQPYDRSPPTSRSSTGTPPSSPDQSIIDDTLLGTSGEPIMVGKEQKRYRREDANKRERARMHTVNSAFDHLRQLVPTYPSNRKLSKIETLRLACSYIQDLTKLVNDNNIQSIHGKDVDLMYGGSELREAGFGGQSGHYPASTGNGTATVPAAYLNPMTTKGEYSTPPDFNTPQNFCYQPYVNSDAESCQSEPDIPSPTHQYNMYMSSTPAGIAVRPPPAISRVSSDSIIAMHMANASIGSNSPTYCAGSPGAGAPCSPLTRAQQHSTSSMSHNNQVTLHCNATPLSSSLQSAPFSNIPIFPHQCYSQ